jgi:rare lipoprotein A (peptidoglycan hydrolase)
MKKLIINVIVSGLVALPGPAETSHSDTLRPDAIYQPAITNNSVPAVAKPRADASPEETPAKARKLDLEPVGEVGLASWYGDEFNGRPTANGEIFDKDGLSAAHPLLPLGTWIKVTNLSNLRSVVVRINDRGPYVDGRVLDLSEAAAKRLGYKIAGLATVDIHVVKTLRGSPNAPARSSSLDSR